MEQRDNSGYLVDQNTGKGPDTLTPFLRRLAVICRVPIS